MIDKEMTIALERFLLGEILTTQGERCGRLVAVLAGYCPPPMARWFSDAAHRKAAVVIDQALAGTCAASGPDMIERLSMIPHAWAVDEIAGKGRGPWTACEHQDSVLAAIGGYSAIGDWHQTSGHRGSTDITACAQVLRGVGQVRMLRAAIADVIKSINSCDPISGPGEAWSALQIAGNRILAGGQDRTLGTCLADAIASGKAQAEIRRSGRGHAVTWGLPALDALVPMRPGGLYVLAAGPGCGKTSLALQATVATADASGTGSVAYAALEMTGAELATIVAGRALHIAPGAIREGADGLPWDEVQALADQWSASGALMMRDAADMADRVTVGVVTSWFSARSSAGGLALCALDYLGLLDGTNERETEYQTITKATKALKRAALAMKVPLLVLAQMNRAGRSALKAKDTGKLVADPEPTLTDLRGSGSIEQDADAVIFLHRDCAPDCPDPTIPMRAIVAKHRAGATGSVPLWFHRRHQLFVEMEVEPSEDEKLATARADRMRSPPNSIEDVF